MEERQPDDGKYLALWLSVFIAGIIIVGGWYFSAKYNLTKINNHFNETVNKDAEIVRDVNNIFQEMGDVLEESSDLEIFSMETNPDEVPEEAQKKLPVSDYEDVEEDVSAGDDTKHEEESEVE